MAEDSAPPPPATHQMQRSAEPRNGSQTQTETLTLTQQAPPILRLTGHNAPAGRSVQWDPNVVDNENMGKKSSKVCCIYHRPRAVDESSDESSSDSSSSSSDSDSDAGGPSSGPRRDGAGGGDKKHKDHDCGHSHGGKPRRRDGGKPGSRKRKPSPNAYEKQPRPKPSDGGASGPV